MDYRGYACKEVRKKSLDKFVEAVCNCRVTAVVVARSSDRGEGGVEGRGDSAEKPAGIGHDKW
ncbi:hypothetical protein HMPREF3166_00120 [Corynebacterium sp. HMSC08A12]|nr:hypothetical protein HMPREF3166_00120 [Corynebacterium sp. HMSC08A12]